MSDFKSIDALPNQSDRIKGYEEALTQLIARKSVPELK